MKMYNGVSTNPIRQSYTFINVMDKIFDTKYLEKVNNHNI